MARLHSMLHQKQLKALVGAWNTFLYMRVMLSKHLSILSDHSLISILNISSNTLVSIQASG